jgi:hypothetical protein
LENITLIDYRGVIQYETIGELIHRLKHKVHALGIQTGTYKRVLLVMIETLENIMKHGDNLHFTSVTDQEYSPTLTIIKNGNHYLVSSSNLVKRQNIQSLKDKLDHLNGLDQQELKLLYKETITDGVFTETGGASLGLVEMAKISGKAIKYEFFTIDEVYARYTQQILIDEAKD